MSASPFDALVDAAAEDGHQAHGEHSTKHSHNQYGDDAHNELKRKFKDVLRAYWRQHKNNHEGEDTENIEVAQRIATQIFNLYWDKPNYAALRSEKKDILNYLVKHIQLSKTREGSSNNPGLRSALSHKSESKSNATEYDSTKFDDTSSHPKKRSLDLITPAPIRLDIEAVLRNRDSIKFLLPRPVEILRALMHTIPEAQLASSLLIEGISAMLPEILIQNELARQLQTQFGVQAYVTVLQLDGPLYHLLLPSPEDCEMIAGQCVRIRSGNYVMYRAPFASSKKSSSGSSKRRREDLEMDEPVRKRLKTAELEDFAIQSSIAFHPSTPFVKPMPTLFQPQQQHADSSDHYVVDKILHQRWVDNKVQYLLNLKGEGSSIKAWILDETIFSEFDANRRLSKFWQSQNTGKWDELDIPDVEQIISVKEVAGQLMFCVKWVNSNVVAMVPSVIIHKVAPAKVIQFYEARLQFSENSSSSNSNIYDHSHNNNQGVTSPSSLDTQSIASASSSSGFTNKAQLASQPLTAVSH